MRSRALAVGALWPALALLAGGCALARHLTGRRASTTPTTTVRRGPLSLSIHARGSVRPHRSATLVAPPADGGLSIVRLVPTGTSVRKGDSVCELDRQDAQRRLDDARAQQLTAQLDLDRARTDSAVQESGEALERLAARNAVRRAQLDVARNELLSEIEARSNQEALEDARRRQEQLERDLASRQAGREASVAVAAERVRQIADAVAEAQKTLDAMSLRAPIDGLVVVSENADAAGPYRVRGSGVPAYRPGDVVPAGRTILEILDLAEMEVAGQVGESDGAQLSPGQPVSVRLDAVPGPPLAGTVREVATLATRTPWGLRRLDVRFALEGAGRSVRPGVTAEVVVTLPPLADARYVPRQAIFERSGHPIVYRRRGERFEPQEVAIERQTEELAVVSNLAEGDIVALVDPDRDAPGGGR